MTVIKARNIVEDLQIVEDDDSKLIKPPYGCDKCDGYGNIFETSGVRPCECKQRYFRERQLNAIQDRLGLMTFGTFRAITEKHKKAFNLCTGYCRDFSPENNTGLLLHGAAGTGKTHLVSAIYQSLISGGFSGWYGRYTDLLAEIRRGYQDDTAHLIIDRIVANDIVCIDDIGKQKVSDWVREISCDLIDRCYIDKKTLLLTSNLSRPELGQVFDESIASRLIEMCIIVDCSALGDYRERGQEELRI